ncbi:Zinc phosphodiesterase ELAC protein [Schistosoma japonicum]|uniref:Small ribosomal subunit protein mS23 n=1 Tax=Schistosoma japonicum TaxID=6182 RepID=A0A4Z2CTB2_SCHJA|nr:Zinc phosphodiesterase ELAC protein [Schistosoma japonicum]
MINKGALAYEHRPLWYDVYEAFPPRVDPAYHRPCPTNTVRNILYPEDCERAAFYGGQYKSETLNMFKLMDNRSSLSKKLCNVIFQELVFLGTASGYPSPHRGASGVVLRDLCSGSQWLFDCGEGVQIQAQKSPFVHLGKIKCIFVSHLHGDHMFGLPGLLCTIDQKGEANYIISGNESPHNDGASVNIYGPKGLRRFLRLALALSRANLSYTYAVHELILNEKHCPPDWHDWACLEADVTRDPPLFCERPGRDIYANYDGFWYNITNNEENGEIVYAVSIKHTIPSLGWLIIKPDRPPSLCAETAMKLGVPVGRLMGELKQGKTVVVDGKTIQPEDVLKPRLRGHRIAIMGDTYDSSELLRLMQVLHTANHITSITLDTLVHEATLDDSLYEDALNKGHSVPSTVAKLACQLNVRQLVLTHFSHRYDRIESSIENAVKSEVDEQVNCSKKSKSDKKSKPSLQIILDQARATDFTGEIILADDQLLVKIPPVTHNHNIGV